MELDSRLLSALLTVSILEKYHGLALSHDACYAYFFGTYFCFNILDIFGCYWKLIVEVSLTISGYYIIH